MSLLHIYDASDGLIRQTALARGEINQLPVSDAGDLISALMGLRSGPPAFDRILFETHGTPGRIYFGGEGISAQTWRQVKNYGFTEIVKPNAKIYFNGCNVAEGAEGWKFLTAVAEAFLKRGGQVIGQTSKGFGNPFNGHVVHFWGNVRVLYVDSNGRTVERFEQ